MIKTYDITVRSNHSNNWYDSFRVDTDHNIVFFVQRDARRNGQVARHMTITFLKDDAYIIEALSAEGGRYESLNHTQCLELAHSLLEEAHSEARQVSGVKDMTSVNDVKTTAKSSYFDDVWIVLGGSFIAFLLLPVLCTITLGYDEYLTVVRTWAILIGAFLSIYALVGAYNCKKAHESKE